jgi:hypothetical protein
MLPARLWTHPKIRERKMQEPVKAIKPKTLRDGSLYPRRFKGKCQADQIRPVATAAAMGLPGNNRGCK